MKNNLDNKILYIEDIILNNNELEIYLNKNNYPYFLNELDKLPILKLKIINHNCNLNINEIKNQIDPYGDGIIYNITETEKNVTVNTTDIGGRVFSISGSKVTKTEIPYSIDQMWNIILTYKKLSEDLETQIIQLKNKIENIEKYVKKEIKNTDVVLNSSLLIKSKLKWQIKKDILFTLNNFLN